MNKLKMNKVWSYIGRFGTIIALIWGCTQLINYFFLKNEYYGIGEGNFYYYEESPNRIVEYTELLHETFSQLSKSIKEEDVQDIPLKTIQKIDSLFFESNFMNIGTALEIAKNSKFIVYNNMWIFTIKNTCNNTLEELKLIFPYWGCFRLELPDMVSYDECIKGNFQKFIDIGELKPGEEARIICWTPINLQAMQKDSKESFQKEVKFRHRKGVIPIKYQEEVSTLYVWNKRYYNIPLMLGLVVFIPLLIYFGYVFGKKKREKTYDEMVDELRKNKD